MRFICGPCALESKDLAFEVAEHLCEIQKRLGIQITFKSSYDKANRTSTSSGRGVGLTKGLEILSLVRENYGLPILTDVHSVEEASQVGEVVDVVQIPALLCRQTDIIEAACASGAEVNIKKGQFLSPEESLLLYQKALEFNPKKVYICERGSSFGYHNLVNDFKSVRFLLNHEVPVVFDATHSVQLPGGLGSSTGGQREYVESLARAAAIIGVKNFFFETHPNPEQAISDGPNMVPLAQLEAVLTNIKKIADFESTLLNVPLND